MRTIEVQYGYENRAKGGRNMPVRLGIDNRADAAMEGSVEFLFRQPDGELYAYAYPLRLTAGETYSASYVVPLSVGADAFWVRLRDSEGKLSETKRVELTQSGGEPELFIGLLSDSPEALAYLNGVSVNYGQMKTRTFALSERDFPEDRRQLDAFDVVVISNYQVSKLSVRQVRALMQWMRNGGVLLFGTGERVNDTLGMFAPEFLDDMYEQPTIQELSLAATDGLSVQTPGTEDEAEAPVALPYVHISLHGGSEVVSAGERPLITAANKGSGVLAVSSIDLTALHDYASAHTQYTDQLLTRLLGSARLERLASEAQSVRYGEEWSAETLVDNGAATLLPNLLGYGALLFFYLLLVGPALYAVLRHFRSERIYRRAAIAVTVFFAGLTWLFSAGSRFRSPFYSYASIQEAGEDVLSETVYVNLRNPRHKSYRLALEAGSEIVPLATAKQTAANSGVSGEEEADLTVSERGTERELAVRNPAAFNAKLLRMEKSTANEQSFGFSGDLSLFGDKVSGTVTNRYPYAVNNAFLLFYGKVVALGRMEANETVDVSERNVYNIPLNNKPMVAAFLTGVYDGGKSERERLRALERADFLGFYLSQVAGNYTPDARVVAFSEEEPAGKAVETEGLRHFGMNLLTSVLTVDAREDERISRSALMRVPEVLSGDYIAATNSFYRGDPVVLSYKLGKNFRTEALLLEAPDAIFESGEAGENAAEFRGVISFYNYRSGNFDDIEAGKTRFTAEELAPYFALDQTITVRYAEEKSTSPNRLDVALPWITVIGEES